MDAVVRASEKPDAGESLVIARQPVYTGKMGVFGYELLFRRSSGERGKLVPAQATAQVLTSAILGCDLNDLVYKSKAIVNITRAYVDVMPQIQLPAEQMVLDLPDNIAIDKDLIEGLKRLKSLGYELSLGGVQTLKQPALLGLADNFRVDVKRFDAGQLDRLTKYLRRFDNLALRALKVETLEEFDLYNQAGYDLFQGNFLGRPRIKQMRELSVNRLTIMELLAAVHNADTTVHELETKIVRDVSLSFRLLKLVNSPFFGVPQEVESVGRAVVLLGRDEIRKLVSLLALNGSGDQPVAIMELALLRARFCELLGVRMGQPGDAFFTVGMFSALDILLEQPLRKLVADLPLCESIKDAILTHEGVMGRALACVLAVENTQWESIAFDGLDQETVFEVQREALQWVNGVLRHI